MGAGQISRKFSQSMSQNLYFKLKQKYMPYESKIKSIIHASGSPRRPRAHKTYPRFVALLDVLGMKAWLDDESSQKVAESVDDAMGWCELSSSGSLNDQSYGPLISMTHFSDTLLAWSPDESWASFFTLSRAMQIIVRKALEKGVPLRGSISHGNVVCNLTTQKFIGDPIADAYIWSEKCARRPYKSVGIDVTPKTIEKIRAKLKVEPIPVWWDSNYICSHSKVLNFSELSCMSDLFIWYRKSLFIDHWRFLSTGISPKEMFLKRGLKENSAVEEKTAEMVEFLKFENDLFFEFKRNLRERDIEISRDFSNSLFQNGIRRAEDYLQLDQIKREREAIDALQHIVQNT
ncbi:MAG: hypothetical protein RLZZ321_2065 [Bacteroidota bacterium]